MNFERILANLPEPLEVALQTITERIDGESNSEEINYAEACTILSAFYEHNRLEKPDPVNANTSPFANFAGSSEINLTIAKAETRWKRQYLGYKKDIQHRWMKWKASEVSDILARKQEENFGYAILSSQDKELIQTHLKHIREIVERSSLGDRKKNKLFSRIAALASEADRNGTYTDRFFAFMGDLAFTSGEMANDSKPAIDEFREILKIIMRSREKAEGVTLPKPEDLPQLPPPGSI